jgi:hypothetical protein
MVNVATRTEPIGAEVGLRPTDDSNSLLKKGIWLYFFLLIFEGALRKWFLPGLATPLLIIRDPVALWLIAVTWKRGLLPSNAYLTTMVAIGIIGIFTALFLGHGNLLVALYGARILLLQFPLIFVIGRIFNREDVISMGKGVLWVTLPMTVLLFLQFYSPQSAWVNRGVGGNMEGAGFSGALEYFRPPGTFAFTNGTTLFYSMVGCFVFYFWLNPNNVNRLLLLAASGALLIAIPLSISRALFFQVAITLLFVLIATLRKPKYLFQVIIALIVISGVVAVLGSTSGFSTATVAFTSRFDTAGEQEGGLKGTLGDRFVGDLVNSLIGSADQPFFGYGLGMGTNVGSMLLQGGFGFLIAEGEWGRMVGELGPLMGLIAILVRIRLGLKIAVAAYSKLALGDVLPWVLLSFGLLEIVQAQWAQPTSLGFSIWAAGLTVASLRSKLPPKQALPTN